MFFLEVTCLLPFRIGFSTRRPLSKRASLVSSSWRTSTRHMCSKCQDLEIKRYIDVMFTFSILDATGLFALTAWPEIPARPSANPGSTVVIYAALHRIPQCHRCSQNHSKGLCLCGTAQFGVSNLFYPPVRIIVNNNIPSWFFLVSRSPMRATFHHRLHLTSFGTWVNWSRTG